MAGYSFLLRGRHTQANLKAQRGLTNPATLLAYLVAPCLTGCPTKAQHMGETKTDRTHESPWDLPLSATQPRQPTKP